jgi:hypothetical protein
MPQIIRYIILSYPLTLLTNVTRLLFPPKPSMRWSKSMLLWMTQFFNLVPHAFAVHAHAVWMDMGSPEPQFSNAWDIYLHICDVL